MLKKNLLPLRLQMFAENPPTDPAADPVDGKPVDPQNQPDPGKTYTQEELEKIVKQRVSREKKAADEAIKEAEKLAKMNADEKKEYEFKKLQDELAELKKKDAFYGLSKEATKMLSEHDIFADDEVLSFVVKEDADTTKTAVDSFVKLINAKVQEGVKQALAGKTPKANATSGQTITKQEILEIKDSFERKQKIAENPHLFQK